MDAGTHPDFHPVSFIPNKEGTRLRTEIIIEQVRDLRAYEVAHQSRPEFIKMYDNRIAKLEAEA